MVKIELRELLNRAEAEEKNYNWGEAAELYEQVAKLFLDENKLEDAARVYAKFGDNSLRAVRASKTKEDYLNWSGQSVKAFHKAENYFIQTNDKLLSLECKAKALNAMGYTITSIEKGKDVLQESIKICLDLNKIYSNRTNKRNLIRISILILDSIGFLYNLCKKPSDFEYYFKLSRSLIDNAWALLKKNENINFRTELLFKENFLLLLTRYTDLIYGDKKEEELRKKFFKKCEETLDLVKDCDDFSILGKVYLASGGHYCFFGTLFAKEKNERMRLIEKGFNLLEKAITFFRTTKDYINLILAIYSLDYLAGLFGRFEYYQKRIFRDVHELENFNKVYDGFHTSHGLYISRISFVYYLNFTSKGFFKNDTRKSFAKAGIKIAKKNLEGLAFGPFLALDSQALTRFYSQLVILANEDDPQQEYIQKMFYYADQAKNYSKGYIGGTVRSAGFDSIYRANKTMADSVKDKETKIKHLKIAIEAATSNIKYAVESYNLFLAAQMRLGLLHEEIGILTTEKKPLMEARALFLRLIKEISEKGYYFHYTAAIYEYLARLEDRLGNHMASAGYYDKAEKAHNKSLMEIEFKPLKDRVNEKIKYAEAWNLIEKAKTFHKGEQHLSAKEYYGKASKILENLPNFNYEANYYGAWVSLEEAEDFSKQEKYNDAINSYEKTKNQFSTAIMMIRFIRKNVKKSKEMKKLEKVAKVRINYCSARITLEEARILGKQGDHIAASEKFALAASKFKDTCFLFKMKRERKDLEAVFHLCKAWETMELAENFEDPLKFTEAASMFVKASDFFTESKLKFLAQGNSNFCIALEIGCKFDQSNDIEVKTRLYPKVKSILRKAANSYEKGGFKFGAKWALATSTYFDAAWHLIRADEELDINLKQELLNIGSNYLESAAELFGESGYKEKEKEVLKRLDRVVREEEILVSALNTIKKPGISRTMDGIVAPSCPIESSQSPRISEISQFSEEVVSFSEKDNYRKKYETVYKDLLEEHPEVTQKSEIRVGIAQFGVSATGDIVSEFFKQTTSGLLRIKKSKIDGIKYRVKEMVEDAQKNGVNLLIFPEMMIDMNDREILEDLINLSKSYEMYIVPGSYHDLKSKKNICKVISPDGILWEQEKHIPAIIHIGGKRFKEGIVTSSYPRKIVIVNTPFGRIAIAICRDFLDMDLRVELKNFEPPVDIILNPAFTPVTADFKATHFDARRSIYAYCFFCNVAEFGESLIYTPEKDRTERILTVKKEGLIFKDVNLFKLRSERKKWEIEKKKGTQFIQSTR
ncbi:MAG: carbon-nitrogen hydrolase family protein [Promethearchaeota archaeon]|jgi:predicted amidohydrolase